MRAAIALVLLAACVPPAREPPHNDEQPILSAAYRKKFEERLEAASRPTIQERPPPTDPVPYTPKFVYHMDTKACEDPRIPVVLEQCHIRGEGHRWFTCPRTLSFAMRNFARDEMGYLYADCHLTGAKEAPTAQAKPCRQIEAAPNHDWLTNETLPAAQVIETGDCTGGEGPSQASGPVRGKH